jgi:hypothetical protein
MLQLLMNGRQLDDMPLQVLCRLLPLWQMALVVVRRRRRRRLEEEEEEEEEGRGLELTC